MFSDNLLMNPILFCMTKERPKTCMAKGRHSSDRENTCLPKLLKYEICIFMVHNKSIASKVVL